MNVTRPVLAMLSALATAGSLGLAGSAPADSPAAASATSRGDVAQVAASSTTTTRMWLTATRVDTAEPARATVRLHGSVRTDDGGWASAGSVQVGRSGSWFWHVVSGRHAVCRWSVSDTGSRTVRVRLTESPSLGCSDLRTFSVEDGRLVRG